MANNEDINFQRLERELQAAVKADEKYQRENAAKFRAVDQRVGTYEEFRDIVLASHLKPLERKDISGNGKDCLRPWNSSLNSSNRASETQADDFGRSHGENIRSSVVLRTTSEFNRDWKHCTSSELRYEFLASLGGANLSKIFKLDIGVAPLGIMISDLNDNYSEENRVAIKDILTGISRCQRLDLAMVFLTKNEKKALSDLLVKICTDTDSGEEDLIFKSFSV